MSALCDVMRVLTSLCVLFFIQAKTSKSGFSTELGPAKRQVVQKPKGVQSESVKAFLQKKEQEEKAKGKSSIFKISITIFKCVNILVIITLILKKILWFL